MEAHFRDFKLLFTKISNLYLEILFFFNILFMSVGFHKFPQWNNSYFLFHKLHL